jgi:hypothetical protein
MVPSTSPVHEVDPEVLQSMIEISDQFAIEGEFVAGEEIHSGHINSTYRATFEAADGSLNRYILQRINRAVFKDPLAVMRNVEA